MKNKFKYAFAGLFSLCKDKSFQIQLLLGFITIISCFILKINRHSFYIVLLCILFVLIAEALNTIIEKVCDLISTKHDLRIKLIKDMAAGMVLIACLGSILIFTLILIERFK